MTEFTPWSALIGGMIIGASAALLMLLLGRVAGVSGILGGLLPPVRGDAAWRVAFLAGLPLGALLWELGPGVADSIRIEAGLPVIVAGGLLVGFGTRLGSGCTSGHGVCGLASLSLRSVAAVAVFMAAAGVTVFLVRHFPGGGPS